MGLGLGATSDFKTESGHFFILINYYLFYSFSPETVYLYLTKRNNYNLFTKGITSFGKMKQKHEVESKYRKKKSRRTPISIMQGYFIYVDLSFLEKVQKAVFAYI